jgi:tetratricopeptide (TPR) repeat protein
VISTLSVQNKAKVVVITDACRSGTLAGNSVGGAQATASNLAKQFANEIKILSCQPNEYSIEGEQWGGGRGAFSYNLIDALYGLADANKDLFITLQEVGRYLEDHVPIEVAPVSQMPMVLGNRNEKIATVNPSVLALLQSGKTNQLAMLSAIDTRGIEDDVLSSLDLKSKEIYQAFNVALKNKRFLEPESDCAAYFYNKLILDSGFTKLHSTIKRNFAAALQDDAQQAINIWLKADIQELDCIGSKLKINPIPKQLEKAMELLGKDHYMFQSLLARKKLFEGILLAWSNRNTNIEHGRKCIELFKQAILLEPQSPVSYAQMIEVYGANLKDLDSALICAKAAMNITPRWILPYTNLSYIAMQLNNSEVAFQALKEAEKIDSLNPNVINAWATWYSNQNDPDEFSKSIKMFEQYRDANGKMFPCWFNNYGGSLMELGDFENAEKEIKNGIAMDSTVAELWNTLSMAYFNSKRYQEAEFAIRKAISFDPSDQNNLVNLGAILNMSRRFDEAEPLWKKLILLDSTNTNALVNLGYMYIQKGQFVQAEFNLKKALSFEPKNTGALDNLGDLYNRTKRFQEAKTILKECISISPPKSEVWSHLGFSCYSLKEFNEAEQAAKNAIAIDSSRVSNYTLLGLVYLKLGKTEDAKMGFQKSIEIDPNFPRSYLGLAYLSLQTSNNVNDALKFIEKAIQKGIQKKALDTDIELEPLRNTVDWKKLMKKYFKA